MPEVRTFDEQDARATYIANSQFFGRHSKSGTNALLTVTLSASPFPNRVTFFYIHWSFDAAPTNAILTITDGGVTETIYITAAGPGHLPFEGSAFAQNSDVVITLTAGGAGINSSLSVLGVRST